MGRTVSKCVACSEEREIISHGLCDRCRHRKVAEAEREADVTRSLIAGMIDPKAARRHFAEQKRAFRILTSLRALANEALYEGIFPPAKVAAILGALPTWSEVDQYLQRDIAPHIEPEPAKSGEAESGETEKADSTSTPTEGVEVVESGEAESGADSASTPHLLTELVIKDAIIIKLGNGELTYVENFATEPEWFERLMKELPWTPEKVKIRGKDRILRRQTVNYGADYHYNPRAKAAIPFGPGPVLELKQRLEALTGGEVYSQCACNLYPDGKTGIGVHHDKEHPILIASISFGAQRVMAFAPKGAEKHDPTLPMLPLKSGSVVLFSDAVNEVYKHAILEDKSTEPRISVTFREFRTAAVPVFRAA